MNSENLSASEGSEVEGDIVIGTHYFNPVREQGAMNDPWGFGWTQLLTIIGFVITVSIAIGGFRSFNRWKREKLEEKRIEIAYEALALAYEAGYVYQRLENTPYVDVGEKDEWEKRLQENKEFFERVWKLQPRCMALLNSEMEKTFELLHRSIAYFRSRKSYREMERLKTAGRGERPTPAFVGSQESKDLIEFQKRIENLCRPIVDRRYKQVQLPPRSFRRGGFGKMNPWKPSDV